MHKGLPGLFEAMWRPTHKQHIISVNGERCAESNGRLLLSYIVYLHFSRLQVKWGIKINLSLIMYWSDLLWQHLYSILQVRLILEK